MNERIYELFDQASGEFCKQNPYATIMLPAPLREKFAELIVRECLTIVDDLVDKQADGSWTSNELYTDYNGALHLADQQIKQHFGVEL